MILTLEPRVLVCGGRDYRDGAHVYRVLDEIRPAFIISGGATGADTYAIYWALQSQVPYLVVPARWNDLGLSAGYRRNQLLIDWGKPTRGVAFPGGDGTADMVARLVATGIPVRDERKASR